MIKVYIDDDRVIAVRENLSIVINDASFALTDQEKTNLRTVGYDNASVFITAGDAGLKSQLDVSHIIGIEYEEGENYYGRELLKSPPPEGTIVLDQDADALKFHTKTWSYGGTVMEIEDTFEYTIIYLPV